MDDFKRLGHAFLTHRAQTVYKSPPNIGALGSHRQGLQNILTRANAAIQMHLDLVANRVQNGLEHPDRGQGPIKLAPAMVRHDDRIRTHLSGLLRIFYIKDTFDDHGAVPHFAELFDPVPIKALIKGLRCP